jgi:hypothetical protein
LVVNPAEERFWEPIFKEGGETIHIVPPMAEAELVARGAERCADAPGTNLLPAEFSTKYRQQFVDGLWMRGVFAILGAYVLGVLVYFGMLYGLNFKFQHVKQELDNLGESYTNACKDAERLRILTDRQELKFAALSCWKAVAENLPENLTVDLLYFDRGKLELQGTAGANDGDAVTIFNEAMRHVPDPNKANTTLFADVSPPTIPRIDAAKGTLEWKFNCKLKESSSE